MSFRKCYEPHLRDYPDCMQECGLDTCEAPLTKKEFEALLTKAAQPLQKLGQKPDQAEGETSGQQNSDDCNGSHTR